MLTLWLLLGCTADKAADKAPIDETGGTETGEDETGAPDTAETAHSGESADTGESAETAHSGESAETAETGETAETAEPSDCEDPEVWNGRDDDCDGTTDRVVVDDVAAYATSGSEPNGRITSIDNLTSGDMDGDGLAELVVGSPFEAAESGRLYTLDGAGVVSWSGVIEEDAAWWVQGAREGDQLGFVSNALGDLDGDGLADLIVGARGADGGRAYVLLGTPGEGELSLSAAAVTVVGDDDGSAGYAVDGAEDLDGDGVADLVVGDPGANTPGVGVFSGAGAAGTLDLSDADASLRGSSDDRSGETVVSGEVDGDGYPDLVLGRPAASSQIGVVLGGATLPAGELDERCWLNVTDSGGGWMGSNSRGVGRPADLDQSGAADLVIADYHMAEEVYIFVDPSGGTLAYSAADTTLRVDGADPGSTVATGHVDDDGAPDLVIGGYLDATDGTDGGALYLLWGGPGLLRGAVDRDTVDGVMDAGSGTRYLGTAVTLPGDLDGDALPDLVVGASWDATLAPKGGTLYVAPGH